MKLYKRVAGQVVAYHEAWLNGRQITEHWGVLGERGDTREHSVNSSFTEERNLERTLESARAAGYEAIDVEDHAVLLIEFPVVGMGTTSDLEKRHALQDRMDETLGWTGLGHCDGGSIGSGTMEVCCLVVDFETARAVIERDLAESEFSDYSRIYEEGAP